MQWKNIVYQYIFTMIYALITALWQVGTEDAVIFPKKLDWVCASETRTWNVDNQNCLFEQCILWFMIFMGV